MKNGKKSTAETKSEGCKTRNAVVSFLLCSLIAWGCFFWGVYLAPQVKQFTTWHFPPESPPSAVTPLVYSPDLQPFVGVWTIEAQRRYTNCVLVMSHGTAVAGEWMCDDGTGNLIKITTLVDELRDSYPDRRIVLVVCNPGGFDIDEPGVTHALEDVWVVPDAALLGREGGTGSIFEFDHD